MAFIVAGIVAEIIPIFVAIIVAISVPFFITFVIRLLRFCRAVGIADLVTCVFAGAITTEPLLFKFLLSIVANNTGTDRKRNHCGEKKTEPF